MLKHSLMSYQKLHWHLPKLMKFLFENLADIYYKERFILYGKLWQS